MMNQEKQQQRRVGQYQWRGNKNGCTNDDGKCIMRNNSNSNSNEDNKVNSANPNPDSNTPNPSPNASNIIYHPTATHQPAFQHLPSNNHQQKWQQRSSSSQDHHYPHNQQKQNPTNEQDQEQDQESCEMGFEQFLMGIGECAREEVEEGGDLLGGVGSGVVVIGDGGKVVELRLAGDADSYDWPSQGRANRNAEIDGYGGISSPEGHRDYQTGTHLHPVQVTGHHQGGCCRGSGDQVEDNLYGDQDDDIQQIQGLSSISNIDQNDLSQQLIKHKDDDGSNNYNDNYEDDQDMIDFGQYLSLQPKLSIQQQQQQPLSQQPSQQPTQQRQPQTHPKPTLSHSHSPSPSHQSPLQSPSHSQQSQEPPFNAGYGSFLKEMEQWAEDVSFEEEVHDIWQGNEEKGDKRKQGEQGGQQGGVCQEGEVREEEVVRVRDGDQQGQGDGAREGLQEEEEERNTQPQFHHQPFTLTKINRKLLGQRYVIDFSDKSQMVGQKEEGLGLDVKYGQEEEGHVLKYQQVKEQPKQQERQQELNKNKGSYQLMTSQTILKRDNNNSTNANNNNESNKNNLDNNANKNNHNQIQISIPPIINLKAVLNNNKGNGINDNINDCSSNPTPTPHISRMGNLQYSPHSTTCPQSPSLLSLIESIEHLCQQHPPIHHHNPTLPTIKLHQSQCQPIHSHHHQHSSKDQQQQRQEKSHDQQQYMSKLVELLVFGRRIKQKEKRDE